MVAGEQTRGLNVGQAAPPPADERLERALVAGLMLEVILVEPGLPEDPPIRRRLVKSRLTASLVAHLSGHITLDRFRHLMHRLQQWFPLYYPLLPTPARPPAEGQAGPSEPGRAAASLVRLDLLREWLENSGRAFLPRRPQRKIQPQRLQEFLQRTRGGWFRLPELAAHFDIDRKTAWEYVQKLQRAGLLLHNGGHSAAVRYRLADPFLKVRFTPLKRQIDSALGGFPRPLRERLTAWLGSTTGESFWEARWPEPWCAGRRPEITALLVSAGVLEVVCRSDGQRLLRLQRQWLNESPDSGENSSRPKTEN